MFSESLPSVEELHAGYLPAGEYRPSTPSMHASEILGFTEASPAAPLSRMLSAAKGVLLHRAVLASDFMKPLRDHLRDDPELRDALNFLGENELHGFAWMYGSSGHAVNYNKQRSKGKPKLTIPIHMIASVDPERTRTNLAKTRDALLELAEFVKWDKVLRQLRNREFEWEFALEARGDVTKEQRDVFAKITAERIAAGVSDQLDALEAATSTEEREALRIDIEKRIDEAKAEVEEKIGIKLDI